MLWLIHSRYKRCIKTKYEQCIYMVKLVLTIFWNITRCICENRSVQRKKVSYVYKQKYISNKYAALDFARKATAHVTTQLAD